MTGATGLSRQTADDMKRALLEWAGTRRCISCREIGTLHRPTIVEGARGLRYALVRTIGGRIHEFDPGERRRDPR